MEPVAIFPEGSTQLLASILGNIGRDGASNASQVHDAVLTGSVKVAEGSFGKVYSLAGSAQPTVVKQVTAEDSRTACNAMKEGMLLSVMAAGCQDYIPTLRDAFLDHNSCFFVMDQARKSLDAHLPVRGPAFPQHELGVLAVSLLAAVHGLHTAGLLHNDLKPKNLLLAGQADAPTIQIIDLDAATLLAMPAAAGAPCARNCNGTTAYLSPERLLTGNCSKQSDMWAVGIILYELLEGRRKYPFNWQGRRMTATMMEDRIGKLATRGTSLPSTLKSGPWGPLLQGLLHKDPARRWGIRECACFPGFQDAFFIEAAARAPPTHAALIQQLLVMRKVWQAAAACWQYDGIRQSFCQEVDPLAMHAVPAGLLSQKIGECTDDDVSEDDSDECEAAAAGGADVCEGAAEAHSRTVSTIVFSSDDEDDEGGCSSSSCSSSNDIDMLTSRSANDTCDQAAPIPEGSMPPSGSRCSKALCTAGASVCSITAADGPLRNSHTAEDSYNRGLQPTGTALPESDLGLGAGGLGAAQSTEHKASTFSILETTPRPPTDDDTKSSFRIAAAWPPGGKATGDGLLLAADGQADAPPGQGNRLEYGQLLDTHLLAKMYIKSTLSDKATQNEPILVITAPELVVP